LRRVLFLLLVGLLLRAAPARADLVSVTDNPFVGIAHTHVFGTIPGTPRSLDYHLIDINLSAPGIRFEVSPGVAGMPGYTQPQTTRDFVGSIGAQVGINANFFGLPGAPGGPVPLVGLASSNGNLYAPTPFGTALNISATNQATFFDGSPGGAGISPYNAVSGYIRLITSGVITSDLGTDLDPRTAIGITQSGHLLLLTVDGREPGHSDGMTRYELAQTLLSYGAYDAVNFDGGGSTTLVMANPSATVVNLPSDGFARPVGNSLAVFAAAVPEPSSVALLALGALLGVARLGLVRRRRPASR
jgi:hypothetical protein